MSHFRLAFLLALILANAAVVAAEKISDGRGAPSTDFFVRNWQSSDGLPHDDVFQLLQDHHGYLWVATRLGLCRFDGATFVPCAAPGTHNIFYGLREDVDGSLLLTPRAGDPVRLRNGTATKEPLPAPFTGQAIGLVYLAPDGATWYSLRGKALRIFKGEVQSFGETDGIDPWQWTRFAADGQGRTWLASGKFLSLYKEGRLIRVSIATESDEIRIASTKTGGPWVLTANVALKLDQNDQPVKIAELSRLVGAHYINAVCEDRHGRLWLGTRSQGVHVIAEGRDTQVPTSSESISNIIEDQDGAIWVGSFTGGLSAIGPKIYSLYNKASGLTADIVTAICSDSVGDIWLANGDGGVARLRGSSVEKWLLRDESRIYAARSVAAHPDGGVWATGGTGAALFRIRRDGDTQLLPEVPSGGADASTFAASNGDLWLTTTDRRVGRLHDHRYQLYGPDEGVSASGARSFAESERGELLVGMNDGSVVRFDGTKFIEAIPAIAKPDSAVNAIKTIDNQYWLGTAAQGLLIVDGSRVTRIGSENGLPDDNITQFILDDHDNLWCGSARGVFRLKISDIRRIIAGETHAISALRLGRDEGLGNINCQALSGPGATKGKDGRIWFATRQGALAIDPTAEALTPRAPTVTIEDVRTDDTPQKFSRPFLVNSSARKLEIRFSTLSLSAPSRVQTYYRLEGFDSEWIDSSGRHTAIYPQLPPGEYTFEIRAGFGDPTIEASTDTLRIIIPTPWWQTVGVRVGAVCAVAGLGVFVVRLWSHRRLRLRIEKLERENAIVRERARIAQNIHDDVGASLTRISLLTQASSPESPDANNLERIYETAREITRSLDEIVWAVNPQYDTLNSFINYLTDFAQKFLGAAGIRCRLDIPSAAPAVPLESDFRHELFLCCRETLNNVVKHAAATEVLIRLEFGLPRLVISISDNGRGMLAPRPASPPERISSGHGVPNIRERMHRIGGSVAIESPADGGTTVTLQVHLPAAKTSL